MTRELMHVMVDKQQWQRIRRLDDFMNPDGVEKLYWTDMGVPDTVYCLHDIISHGSEVDFELGLKTCSYKIDFTASLAIYGSPSIDFYPDIVMPDTISNWKVSEYVVNAKSQEFICHTSDIIGEPLKDVEAISVGNSFNSPELELTT
ncbi:hypothetical protein EV421DRAFT_1739972 [Armillaria borealis]|uniref:Uncharacterized protein n=1 Tax=Armillaria borealis TaxID=47425 RepID=A0AA39MIT4_9AGAR|nr:hypothetical protein EV421DRAFT_1739972 [Armillaria borealis]